MCMGATCPTCCKLLRPVGRLCRLPPAFSPYSSASTFTIDNIHLPAKQTWRGCGRHIPQALSGVPETEWCACTPKVTVDGKEYPPAAGTGTAAST
ncbi:uncharacterized protein SPSK_04722 [Sporothrix schenckii 1099-18]|uniref:Uncharacterized protein n=1 Tax=Sporothrix schenckii 1099-18 TaxID=1397361 RepID=A0A0F2M2D2_SPOSC|nr:uncharacterized protein SPSK_04722 [Sporothrix schenckii 1099-18]KJR83254.1 hypothetical protein SPSK_04722 [Sporothrix schenckii 1099-18]